MKLRSLWAFLISLALSCTAYSQGEQLASITETLYAESDWDRGAGEATAQALDRIDAKEESLIDKYESKGFKLEWTHSDSPTLEERTVGDDFEYKATATRELYFVGNGLSASNKKFSPEILAENRSNAKPVLIDIDEPILNALRQKLKGYTSFSIVELQAKTGQIELGKEIQNIRMPTATCILRVGNKCLHLSAKPNACATHPTKCLSTYAIKKTRKSVLRNIAKRMTSQFQPSITGVVNTVPAPRLMCSPRLLISLNS